eukprot:TRINITY_DN10573_c0_g1_i1.p1 TRINITY_DN10573_c0_g1~~TRINITY_DN10573_c0_g1_i1.p1  ORF type:complete len:708 (+),score=117.32 TRINITY_DN10573_c0_g1_i1:351-2474(+)
MASSPSNLHSEPLKIEQIITEFFAKSMRIILESRSIYASSRRNYSGTVSSPSSSSSSSSVRPRDKWFNLVLGECPASLENLDFLRQSNHEPLVIDIVLIQRSENPDAVRPPPSKGSHPKNPSLRDQFLGGWNAGQEQFISEAKRETIIERWTVQYESRKNSGILRDLSSGTKKMGSSTSSHSSETPTLFFKKIYKRSIILLRSLYLTVRLLPAYKLFRDLNSSGKICPFSLAYRVSPFVETFTRREEAEMQPFNFVPVDTTCGKLSLSVLYRRTLLDVSSEPSTPISTQFISDYVGSPTTDPLRSFPSLPLTQLPASPSPVTFARWNSWSNDLHCATPSFSSSPSPTHSDSHALPSKPSSHHLPPRSHVNMNFLHPVSSTHHVPPHTSHLSTESLVHKKNLSFDETWPSPPFSPSPSPSPPTHIGSHPSKALMRTESAPVSIPSARLRQSCGLPNTVLPPSRSPKGTRPGCSSPSDSLRAQASLISVCHSCPTDGKYQVKQDPGGSGECQASSSAHKMHYFPKDDVGNIYGKKLPFSRSSSKQSFQDEFDDSEFPCPFLVDDITDPCNRSESFEGEGHKTESLESQGRLAVKNSHDAAIGSLVGMLQTAAPLQQDSSNLSKFPQVPKPDSWREKILPNQNLVSGKGTRQTSESNIGIVSSGLFMSKTIADALEDLRSYREVKDFILQQSGLDAVLTANTIAKGTLES